MALALFASSPLPDFRRNKALENDLFNNRLIVLSKYISDTSKVINEEDDE
jgi:hypothetical protein